MAKRRQQRTFLDAEMDEYIFLDRPPEISADDFQEEPAEMCKTCIHKVTKDDIEAIRAAAIDEAFDKLWITATSKYDEALCLEELSEDIDAVKKQIKEQKNE